MKNAETLLSHASFLKSLSRALVSDPNVAEDLVQDTWLATLHKPPHRLDQAKAWLARILKNKAVSRFRSESRLRHREEKTARGEMVLERDSQLDREEVAVRVLDSVLQLKEPYLSTVLMRYYQELSVQEIASRQSISVDTVKTRLKRAHNQLRNDLQRDFGKNRKRFTAGMLILAHPGLSAESAMSTAATSFTTAGSSATLTATGVVVSSKITVALSTTCVLFALTGAYLFTELQTAKGNATQLGEDVDQLKADIRGLQKDLRITKGNLKTREDVLSRLRKQLLDEEKKQLALIDQLKQQREQVSTATPSVAKELSTAPSYSIEEASELGDDYIERGDLEGLILLAPELLKLGEEGREKILELARLLEEEETMRKFQSLVHHEEYFMAPALRVATEHADAIMDFFSETKDIPDSEFPRILEHMREGFLEGNENAMLIFGLKTKGDHTSLNKFVDIYQDRLNGDDLSERKRQSMIRALAMIRTDKALDLLVSQLDSPKYTPRQLRAVVESITQQRASSAVPKLKALLGRTNDPDLQETIRWAVNFLK